jgi:hypothetical protein
VRRHFYSHATQSKLFGYLGTRTGSCRRQGTGLRNGLVKHVTLREVIPSAISLLFLLLSVLELSTLSVDLGACADGPIFLWLISRNSLRRENNSSDVALLTLPRRILIKLHASSRHD